MPSSKNFPARPSRPHAAAGQTAAQASARFQVYPAIDVREGAVVRLSQGDYLRQTRYAGAPLTVIRRYADSGASWLHLVDLDAARAGAYTLLPLLEDVARSTGLEVQTGGGVRCEQDVERILAAGAGRVVVGSVAVSAPETVCAWLARFGSDRITVALDTRQSADGRWWLPTHGWTVDSGVELETLLRRYSDAGLVHLLCTDIACDGMQVGPNVPLYRWMTSLAPGLQVQASGGVRNVSDLVAVRAAGCSGAVIGKALLEGGVALADALSVQHDGAFLC